MAKIKHIISALCCMLSISAVAQVMSFERNGLDSLPVYKSVSAALNSGLPVYRLDLSRQKLKEIPSEVFAFTELRELNLSRNKINELPDQIAKLSQLEVLIVSSNKLIHLPDSLEGLEALRLLDASDNALEEIPDHINTLRSITHLIFWGNVFSYYSESMEQLTKLQYLDLLHNDMDATEQEKIREWFPDVVVSMSDPCKCDFNAE